MKKDNLEEELKETKEQLQETKEKVENLEKSNKKMSPVISVLLGVLFVVIGFVFGYCLSSYLFPDENVDEGNKTEEKEEDKSNEKNEDNDEIEIEKLDVNSAVVKEIFEIFREDTDGFVNPDKGAYYDINTSLETKKYIAYKQLDAKDFSEENCSKFSSKYTKDGAQCGIYSAMEGKARVFTTSILEAKYKELFGQNVDYVDGEFHTSPMTEAYYDKKSSLYAEFYHLDGDERAPYSYIQTLESISHAGNTLSLNTKLMSKAREDFFEDKVINIIYTFEYEESTGNYIFVSRVQE